MALIDLTDKNAVISALDEFVEIGRDAFLKKYGFGKSREYLVRYGEHLCDSKAILGAAHGYQHEQLGPLSHDEFRVAKKY